MSTNHFQLNIISNWDFISTVTVTKVHENKSWSHAIDPLGVINYGPTSEYSFDADAQSNWSVTVACNGVTWSTGTFEIQFPDACAGLLYSFIVVKNPSPQVLVLTPRGAMLQALAQS